MGLFGQNMKKLKIVKLSRDSRYLQKLALNTITNFLFPHDPAAISLTNLAPNMYKSFTNGVAIICTDNYKLELRK